MKRQFCLFILVAICAVISAVLINSQPTSTASSAAGPVVSQDPSDRGPVRMIRFVLSDDGLYPRQMRIDHGVVNVVLDDRTKKSDGLVIEALVDDKRERMTQIARSNDHSRGKSLIRLEPGRYLVSDASQPDRTAELLVNP